MHRGPKPAKSKAKPPVARKSPKRDGAKLRDLERRLAEALKDKAEALEQQTATADILKVISSSPADVQPVFDPILVNATRLCEASFAAVFRYDGEALVLAAHQNASPEFIEYFGRTRLIPSPDGPSRRAALERKTVHVHDLLSDPSFRPLALHTTENARTVLAVPLLREDRLAGVITTWRREARPFTDKQIALLKTFADQAVIAIENVRLFKELQASNQELTTALDKQTATGDILRVISQSQTDVQPVFETILSSAVRLMGAQIGALTLVNDDHFELAAVSTTNPAAEKATKRSSRYLSKSRGRTRTLFAIVRRSILPTRRLVPRLAALSRALPAITAWSQCQCFGMTWRSARSR
jgi:two-component system, NtrC family, sensor kinase